MTLSPREEISRLVDSERLVITALLAPCRTGSTVLLKMLRSSASIADGCNQPFHLTFGEDYKPATDEQREQRAYELILNAYHEAAGREPVHIVVKIMARNLGIGVQFRRFLSVVDTVVLLVRNPLLAHESDIRVAVDDYTSRRDAFSVDLDNYAQAQGYQHWSIMRDAVCRSRDWRQISELQREYNLAFDLNRFQPTMVREYAAHYGHETLADYFAVSASGWSNFASQSDYIRQRGIKHAIVDCSMLRAWPNLMLAELCRIINARFVPGMTTDIDSLGHSAFEHFEHDFLKHFDTAAQTRALRPPSDVPVTSAQLPPDYIRHFYAVSLPTWLDLLSAPARLGPKSWPGLRALLYETPVAGTHLAEIDPVLGYATMGHLLTVEARAELRSRWPGYADVFVHMEALRLRALDDYTLSAGSETSPVP